MSFMKYAQIAIERSIRNIRRKNHLLIDLEERVEEDNHPYRRYSPPLCISTPNLNTETDNARRDIMMATMKKWELEGNYMSAASIAETMGMTDEAMRIYEMISESDDGSTGFYALSRLAELKGDAEAAKRYLDIADDLEDERKND